MYVFVQYASLDETGSKCMYMPCGHATYVYTASGTFKRLIPGE